MTGNRPRIEIADAGQAKEPVADREQSLWWKQPLDLAADAVVWVAAPKTTWMAIGQQALTAAGLEDAEEADIQGTYRELLQQALSSFAQDLGARLRKEISCTEGQIVAAPPSPAGSVLTVQFPDQDPFPVEVVFDAALSGRLLAEQETDAVPETVPGSLVSSGKQPSASDQTPGSNSGTIEVLLDVELPVSISLGRAHLPLKDVLKLTSGSIVELNRSVNEPVEVIVNNCVIARGEVVVVDGNYGIRINQIISRRERLRTLN